MTNISIRKGKFAKEGLRDFTYLCKEKAHIPLRTIVELGSYVGDSTEIFALLFEEVTSIDPWENGYDDNDGASFNHPMWFVEEQFDRMREQFTNIRKIKKKALDAVEEFADESIDMVYIDAKHTYEAVKEDITAWYPKVKIGGIISGHDFQDSHPGVKQAILEILGLPELLGKDTSWGFVKGESI